MYKFKLWCMCLILIVVVSCEKQYPNIDEPGSCERYGVVETGIPIGEVSTIISTPSRDILKICKSSGWVNRLPGGCVLTNTDGTVNVYYEMGNICLKNHELCHARNGPRHTLQYISDVANNHPAPACPSIF